MTLKDIRSSILSQKGSLLIFFSYDSNFNIRIKLISYNGKEDKNMIILIWIFSLIIGLMFGGVILGIFLIALGLDLSFKVCIVIYLVSAALGTWGIRREINGD